MERNQKNPLEALLKAFPGAARRGASFNNPAMPLHFESEPNPDLPLPFQVEPDHSVAVSPQSWSSPEALKAHQHALNGHSDPSRAAQIADEALRLSEICPEAYILRAMYTANNYEEALTHFRKAEELGLQLASASTSQLLSKGDIFGHFPLRPYFRAVCGVTATLIKLARYREARDKLELLLRLEPNWNSYSPYIQFRYLIPTCQIGLGQWTTALDTLNRTPWSDDATTYNSTGLAFAYNRALAFYASDPKYRGWTHGFPAEGHEQDVASLKGPGCARAIVLNPYTARILVGDLPRPTRMSPTLSSLTSTNQAIAYAFVHYDLWHSVEGAVAWLRQSLNLVRLCQAVWPEHYNQQMRNSEQEKIPPVQDQAEFERLLDDVPWKNARVNSGGDTIGHLFARSGTPEMLTAVLRRNFVDINTANEHGLSTPMMASYYDAPVNKLEIMLEHGGDFFSSIEHKPAHMMAANQGNWRVIEFLIKILPTKVPERNRQKILRQMLNSALDSSVFDCVRGGEKCNRCMMGDLPHSSHVDFFKCVELIIWSENGLKPYQPQGSVRVLTQYASALFTAKANGQGLPPRPQVTPATKQPQHHHHHHAGCQHSHGHHHGGHQHAEAAPRTCGVCGTPASNKCGGCGEVWYCGPEHQRADWSRHRRTCKRQDKKAK